MSVRLAAEIGRLRLEGQLTLALTLYMYVGREGNRWAMARRKGKLSRLYREEKP